MTSHLQNSKNYVPQKFVCIRYLKIYKELRVSGKLYKFMDEFMKRFYGEIYELICITYGEIYPFQDGRLKLWSNFKHPVQDCKELRAPRMLQCAP